MGAYPGSSINMQWALIHGCLFPGSSGYKLLAGAYPGSSITGGGRLSRVVHKYVVGVYPGSSIKKLVIYWPNNLIFDILLCNLLQNQSYISGYAQ